MDGFIRFIFLSFVNDIKNAEKVLDARMKMVNKRRWCLECGNGGGDDDDDTEVCSKLVILSFVGMLWIQSYFSIHIS